MQNINQDTGDCFGNVVSTYTQDQAIEDGILVRVGQLTSGQRVVFTHHLFDSGGYEVTEKRVRLVDKGLSLLRQPDPEDTDYMKLRVIDKDRIWVIVDGNGLTFMRPEDY
jgi:type I site-specific restriction endonuclease